VVKLTDELNKTPKKNPLNRLLKDKKASKSEFIVAVIVNIIFLYIINNLMSWNISFIDPSFNEVLWIFNISIIANILANVAFLIYYSDAFRSIIQVLLDILGVLVVYYLYVVFPFVFQDGWFIFAVKFALIVALIAIIIATFVEAIRFILKYIIKIKL